MRRTPVHPALRFLAYGLVGWTADSVFVWVHTGRRRPTSLLNVPVYGLALPLFESVHDRIRNQSAALRAALYGAGILGVEYAAGRLLRTLLGRAPWDYGDPRFAVDRLVRGLALERVHDVLVASEIETGAREYREAVTASPPPARARDLG